MSFDFSNFVDMGIVAGLIIIIQTIKEILKVNKIIFDGVFWLAIVTGMGLIVGFAVSCVDGFNLWNAIGKSITYAGAATLFYQFAKAGFEITVKKE
jgi:hypothetical protein